jgi:tetratricopeptide (TPR) repeat protein
MSQSANLGKWRLPLLVGALVIAALIAFQWVSNREVNNDSLFRQHFFPTENIYQPTPKRKTPETVQAKAFADYDRKNFPESIQWFARIEAPEPPVRFYHANALLAAHQQAEAIPLLERLLNEQHAYRQPTEWFLSLAYLQQGDLDKAIPLLELIINTPGHPYQLQAQGLLEKLS